MRILVATTAKSLFTTTRRRSRFSFLSTLLLRAPFWTDVLVLLLNHSITVLPKRDLNCQLKLVSNEDWEKRFEFFWALAWEKTQMRHDLPPLLSRNLCGSLLFDDNPFSVCFWTSLYFLLTLLFAGYSPFYICLFLFSFAFLSPFSAFFSVLSNFLARFSRPAWRLLLRAFFGRFVYFFPAYFHSKPSLHKLEL